MPNYLSPGVYVEEVEAGNRPIEGVGTAVAAFVGLAEKGPMHQPTLVSNWTQFTEAFGGFVPGTYLAHAVYGYMQNGGNNCFIVRVGGAPTNGHGPAAIGGGTAAAGVKAGADGKAVTGPPQATLGGYTVTATNPGRPKPVSVEVFDPHGDGMGEDMFTLNVLVDGKVVENYDNVSTKEGDAYVVTRTGASKLIRIEATAPDAPLVKVARGAVELVAPEPEPVGPAPDALGADDYVGDVAARTGFSGLEAVEEVTIVAVPDLVAALEHGAINEETFKAVQLGIITHCELMGDRVAILDPPPGKNPQEILKWRVTDAAYDSKFATMYWPYVKVFDPTSGTTTFVPPSGHVAGVWARNDDTRGVHKAPANEVIRGAVSLATQITKAEHDLLNPVGINCIRAFPGRGVRVWGARTLSSDPAWRYLNVRRLFNYLEETILMGTQWVVFEPNDHQLWARIRRTISAFLVNEWRKGALFGTTPDEAFFVKCDDETNPAEGIDAGQVVCQVGVAPVKPAEFVIFQLSQFSGGVSLVNE